MIYGDIMERVMENFYNKDMDFPNNISFPIPFRKDGKIYDLFFIPESLTNQEAPVELSILYMQNISDKSEAQIYDKREDIEPFIFKEINDDIPTFDTSASISFPRLYESVRQFAFDNNITDEQKKEALQLAAFYEQQLDRNFYELYIRLSFDFFLWVKSFKA